MRSISRHSLLLLVASAVLAACSSGGSGSMSSLPADHAASASRSVNSAFNYSAQPKVRRIGDLLSHNCPGGTVCALTPTTLRTSYDFSYVQNSSDGTGQTIVIVDAFGSPNILQDLQFFSTFNGLPAPVTSAGLACTGAWTFCVVFPGGKPSVNLNNAAQLGWAEETSLDVEWAHASAPGARIALVVANNDQGSTIQSTIQTATSLYPGSALSLSFGVQESAVNGGANNTQLAQSELIYLNADTLYHDTVIASAGDLGSSAGFASPNPQYPASDPHVLSVGGTSLSIFNNGKYRSESAWNDGIGCTQPCGATGGAPSTIFPGRNVADVAYDASDNAIAIYMSFVPGSAPGWFAIGGTSIGPPAYAGIVAIANQERSKLIPAKLPLGFVNTELFALYAAQQLTKTPPFHDVTNGNNIFFSNVQCCAAGNGYDNPTGLGTPDVNNLLNVLVNLIP